MIEDILERVRECIERVPRLVLRQASRGATKAEEVMKIAIDGVVEVPKEAIIKAVAGTKYARHWAEGIAKILGLEPGTPEFEKAVEHGSEFIAKRFLGLKMPLLPIEELMPDRKEMLVNYILGLAEAFGVDPVKLLNAEPVKRYAKRLDLEDYLEYLKKHPEILRERAWWLKE